jgi:hypothetical protein
MVRASYLFVFGLTLFGCDDDERQRLERNAANQVMVHQWDERNNRFMDSIKPRLVGGSIVLMNSGASHPECTIMLVDQRANRDPIYGNTDPNGKPYNTYWLDDVSLPEGQNVFALNTFEEQNFERAGPVSGTLPK